MENNKGMETSPLTKELYSIDWAVRFDEFRKYDQTSYTDLHQLLAKIENIVESEIDSDDGDLNDTKVLKDRFSKAEVESPQWHRLSILIHLKIVLAAIPKGLTSTATLSAIQIMEHMWKILSKEQQASQSSIIQTKAKPKAKVIKAAPEPAPRKKSTTAKSTANPKNTNKHPAKTANKTASSKRKNNDTQTENVVIKKLAEEAGLEDKSMETRCYEVACSLAEEYPEYTLTAIRVMTAEKLGVTRQFVENLDIKPARFKKA
ncbi:MAG: hypothetical protein R8G33_09330 [Gammaproteobacteria bacterium]|nr:hypothetical protein [Gammaproteobacteria bacterium]